MDATAAADGILRIAATTMSYAVKGVTTERGFDAGDFALVAYGGAGPLHAVAVAREIGMRNVIIPRAPGVFSAFGMLFSDLRYDFVRTWLTRLEEAPFDKIEKVYRELEDQGRKAIAGASVKPQQITIKRAADMRYVGQEHAVTVDLPASVFRQDAIVRRSSVCSMRCTCCATARRAPRERAEIVSLRTTVDGRDAQAAAGEDQARRLARRPKAAMTGKRPVYFGGGGFRDAPTYRSRGSARRQPHQGAGADRGACLDDGADAGRRLRGRCLRQSCHHGRQARGTGGRAIVCAVSHSLPFSQLHRIAQPAHAAAWAAHGDEDVLPLLLATCRQRSRSVIACC